jgi:hypothetical protein
MEQEDLRSPAAATHRSIIRAPHQLITRLGHFVIQGIEIDVG